MRLSLVSLLFCATLNIFYIFCWLAPGIEHGIAGILFQQSILSWDSQHTLSCCFLQVCIFTILFVILLPNSHSRKNLIKQKNPNTVQWFYMCHLVLRDGVGYLR